MGGQNTPDRGERLRQALQHLRPLAGATPRVERVAGTSGSESSSAQLLYVAQRATWSSPAGFRRSAGVVISTHTKRLRGATPFLFPAIFKPTTQSRSVRWGISCPRARSGRLAGCTVLPSYRASRIEFPLPVPLARRPTSRARIHFSRAVCKLTGLC